MISKTLAASVPPIGTKVKVTLWDNSELYIGEIFCAPYAWEYGVRFALKVDDTHPVFTLGRVYIEEIKEEIIKEGE